MKTYTIPFMVLHVSNREDIDINNKLNFHILVNVVLGLLS